MHLLDEEKVKEELKKIEAMTFEEFVEYGKQCGEELKALEAKDPNFFSNLFKRDKD